MKRSLGIVLIALFILTALAGCSTAAQTSASQTGSQAALTLTLDELSAYNGKDGMPAYIAVDGVIYDVTNISFWKNGEHNGFSAGNDLTQEIKEISPHGVSKLDGVPVVGTLVD